MSLDEGVLSDDARRRRGEGSMTSTSVESSERRIGLAFRGGIAVLRALPGRAGVGQGREVDDPMLRE